MKLIDKNLSKSRYVGISKLYLQKEGDRGSGEIEGELERKPYKSVMEAWERERDGFGMRKADVSAFIKWFG